MELRVLRYFLAVAQARNITHAAQQLLVSQPALSKQLADLEQELGTQLFIRGHRQITLTSAGEYLQARALEMVQLADKTAANIQADQVISGDLSIGAGESLGMQRIMAVMSDITQDYPDVKIHLSSGNAQATEAQLSAGVIDFAVIMGERPLTQYHHLQLPEHDQWGIVMKKDDALAQRLVIRPQDLVGRPLLLSEQALRAQRFQSWWGNLGDQMAILGTFTLVFNAQLLVKHSGAYLLTFDHLVDTSAQSELTFRPLTPSLTEPITVIWKRNTVQSKVAEVFIERLRATMSGNEEEQPSD